jgi:N-methylhydantoinase B
MTLQQMTETTIQLNAVDLEIARNRLESIAEEVGMALIRTSYSPNIKDRRDCSAGLYQPNGELISQAEHIPLHLGLMPTLIQRALHEYGAERLQPGDILITNNPYLGGSHLPDTCVITPVFSKGEVVAIVANMAHHVDVGGITPGSMATHHGDLPGGNPHPPGQTLRRGPGMPRRPLPHPHQRKDRRQNPRGSAGPGGRQPSG